MEFCSFDDTIFSLERYIWRLRFFLSLGYGVFYIEKSDHEWSNIMIIQRCVKAVGYGAGVLAWVRVKRPSHHPRWAWVVAWPLGAWLSSREWGGMAKRAGLFSLGHPPRQAGV
ncbi:hypothetical protein HanIR_Chr01g0037151 [Helianthus annuus]|nr:hypothetical protein HanIR_Chr01g0037151 [Helianthus annuus]